MLEITFVQPFAAALQLGTFTLANFDVFQVSLQLPLVDRRTHVGGLVETIADSQFARALDQAANELAVHTFLHNDATGCSAALPCSAKSSPQSAFESQLQIGIIEHDHGILPAQFQRAMLEGLGRSCPDRSSDGARSSKRNRAH